ncbi:MAG: DUF6049 family protein [Micrococcales bacterium]|nr:DUF6049 family protein [Micrococcales bacterium]
MNGPVPGGRPARWRHAVLGLLGAALVATGGLMGTTAAAVDETPTPTPSPVPPASPSPTPAPTPSSPIVVEVTSITPQVMSIVGDDELTMTVTITNRSVRTVQRGTVTLWLQPTRFTTRTDVDRWLRGTATWATPQIELTSVPLDEPVPPGESVELMLTGRMTDETGKSRLSNVWGPRGLRVELDAGAGARAEARTFLLWESTEDIPAAQVALLAAVVGPAGAPTTLGDETVPAADDRLLRLLDVAAAAPEIGLAVDPALLGQADPAQSLPPWVGSLTTLLDDGREAVALPWSDPDLQVLTHAGAAHLLSAALALSAAARPGLPSDLVWSTEPVSAQTAHLISEAGATRLVDPTRATHPGATQAPRQTPAPRDTPAQEDTGVHAPDLTVLHPDEVLSALFTGTTEQSAAEARQHALALLAVAARGKNGADQVLIVAGRDWEPDLAQSTALVAALRDARWVDLTTTAGLTVTEEVTPLSPTTTPRPGVAAVTSLDQASADLRRFAQVTTDPDVVTAGVDQAVLAVASYAWRHDPTGQEAAADDVLEAISARRGGLALTPITERTIISTSADVRFTVRNDLPVAATVRVRLEPTRPCLEKTTSAPVTVAPHKDTPVTVTLTARANCQVDVRVMLVADDGTIVTDNPDDVFQARVRWQFESVGTQVIAVLLALGLALGVLRTVRRGQSARRGARTISEESPPVHLGVLGGEHTGPIRQVRPTDRPRRTVSAP